MPTVLIQECAAPMGQAVEPRMITFVVPSKVAQLPHGRGTIWHPLHRHWLREQLGSEKGSYRWSSLFRPAAIGTDSYVALRYKLVEVE